MHVRNVNQPEEDAELDEDHWLNDLMSIEVTPDITSYDWKELVSVHLDIWGNSYSKIDYNNVGEAIYLIPLRPEHMEVKVSNGELQYIYTLENGNRTVYVSNEILHIKGLSYDGLCGVNPTAAFKDGLSLAKATIARGSRYFAKGGKSDGFLRVASDMTYSQAEELGTKYDNKVKTGKTPVLAGSTSDGSPMVDYVELTDSPEQQQFLQTRVENNRDIARMIGVPLSIVSDAEAQTYDNVITESRALIRRVIEPRARRFENAINQKFLRPVRNTDGRFEYPDGQVRFVKFDLAELYIRDPINEIDVYTEAVGTPWIAINEARARLDLEPVDGGDDVRVPIMMPPDGDEDEDDSQDNDAVDELERSLAGRNGHR